MTTRLGSSCTIGFAVAALGLARGGALAQSPTTACATPATAPSADGFVRIPIELSNNHVLVPVCSGGRALVFILDSGAGANIVDLSVARDLGVELGAPVQGGGAGAGTVSGAMLDSASVRVPGVATDLPIAMALDLRRQRLSEGRPVNGILGHDFIDRFVMAIDYPRRELRLYDRTKFSYTGSGIVIPVIMENNHPHVRADVTLMDGGRVSGKFVIDVGSTQSLMITKPVVDANRLRTRVGPTMPWGGGGGLGGNVTSELGRIASLTIGPVMLTNVVTALFADSAGVLSSNRLWDGDIGGDILRRFVVFFDYQASKMILEPQSGTSEPFEADMSGLRVVADSSFASIRVTAVLPGSPADQAGIKTGDVIVRVNGREVAAGATGALRERMRREGERVSLTLSRQGSTTEASFVTRRVI